MATYSSLRYSILAVWPHCQDWSVLSAVPYLVLFFLIYKYVIHEYSDRYQTTFQWFCFKNLFKNGIMYKQLYLQPAYLLIYDAPFTKIHFRKRCGNMLTPLLTSACFVHVKILVVDICLFLLRFQIIIDKSPNNY